MNSKLLKELAHQLLEEQDLYSWLQLYSVQTWNKIGFARNRKGLKINETTITQNLVFDFWLLASGSNLPIELYESKNEKANGNDLEIIEETDKGFLLFPCQSKIIQTNNRYSTIHYKNKSRSAYQMDMLLKYANRNKGIPIYLFYNFYSNYKRCYQLEEEVGFPLDYFGCSIISANYLKESFPAKKENEKGKPVIPSFEDLHPSTALAIHDFFKAVQARGLNQLLNFIGHSQNDINYFTKAELQNDKLWEDMAPLPAIGFIIDDEKNKKFLTLLGKKEAPVFNPRFRIIITKTRRQMEVVGYLG